jgi:hypothetical protein
MGVRISLLICLCVENFELVSDGFLMSTVKEIEKAINDLTKEEFWKLTDRLIERREAEWDAQIESDASAGRLDALWAVAEKEIEDGESESLDAFLDHEKF